jgi:hypothetical protein
MIKLPQKGVFMRGNDIFGLDEKRHRRDKPDVSPRCGGFIILIIFDLL